MSECVTQYSVLFVSARKHGRDVHVAIYEARQDSGAGKVDHLCAGG